MRWTRAKRRSTTTPTFPTDRWDPEAELVRWDDRLAWTTRSSWAGACVMGSTGSGKSSASIRMLCASMLRDERHDRGRGGGGCGGGYGGLFCCVKREDAECYAGFVRDAGRERDLFVYSPSNPLRFNVLAAEARLHDNPQHNPGAVGLVDNLTALLMGVCRLGESTPGGARSAGGENAEYFRRASERLCRFAFLVLILSGRPLTVVNLYRLIISSPRSREEPRSPEWRTRSFFFECLHAAERVPKDPSLRADFDLSLLFFMEEWCDLNARTRTTVESTLAAATDALGRGAARDCLCAPDPTFDPGVILDGAIVVLDYPVLVHRETGRLIQVAVKEALMRRLSRRDVRRSPRPVLIVCDECQHLVTEQDALFATTARSSRTALVYATQSLSTLLEAFGGPEAEPRMLGFLGNLQLQIHHQQTDTRTVEYIQHLTGRARQTFINAGTSGQGDWLGTLMGEPSGGSSGVSESMEHDLQASDCNGLVAGGPHGFAEAIVYQGGAAFASGKAWSRLRISQGFSPRRRRRGFLGLGTTHNPRALRRGK